MAQNKQRFKLKMIESDDVELKFGPGMNALNIGIHLDLRDFTQLINIDQINKIERQPEKKPLKKSPSISVTDHSLLKNRMLHLNLSNNMDLQLGKFVNRQIEKKVHKLQEESLREKRTTIPKPLALDVAERIKRNMQAKQHSSLPTTYRAPALIEYEIKKQTKRNQSKVSESKQFEKAYVELKKGMEVEIVRANYKNLPNSRVLDNLDFDQANYDRKLLVYKKNYKYKEFQDKINNYWDTYYQIAAIRRNSPKKRKFNQTQVDFNTDEPLRLNLESKEDIRQETIDNLRVDKSAKKERMN